MNRSVAAFSTSPRSSVPSESRSNILTGSTAVADRADTVPADRNAMDIRRIDRRDIIFDLRAKTHAVGENVTRRVPGGSQRLELLAPGMHQFRGGFHG